MSTLICRSQHICHSYCTTYCFCLAFLLRRDHWIHKIRFQHIPQNSKHMPACVGASKSGQESIWRHSRSVCDWSKLTRPPFTVQPPITSVDRGGINQYKPLPPDKIELVTSKPLHDISTCVVKAVLTYTTIRNDTLQTNWNSFFSFFLSIINKEFELFYVVKLLKPNVK